MYVTIVLEIRFTTKTLIVTHQQKVNRDVTITAANGKSMKALKVFTEALLYMKKDALETIQASTQGRKFIASDFTWVLTVPAIWDPSAKQFMREAATQVTLKTLNRNYVRAAP